MDRRTVQDGSRLHPEAGIVFSDPVTRTRRMNRRWIDIYFVAMALTGRLTVEFRDDRVKDDQKHEYLR